MVLIFLFSSCSSIDKRKWTNLKNRAVFLDFQPGDIVIKEKEFTLFGIFGHSAIMESETVVVDYPRIGKHGYKIDINDWLEKDRNILILRYKNMNEKFKKDLIRNIREYSNYSYKITFNKNNSTFFYCSQYIWFLYNKTAFENNYDLDIDTNRGIFVFPYDLIDKNNFEIITLISL